MANLKDSELIGAADKLAKLGAEARKALKLEESQPSIILNVGLLARPALPARILADKGSEQAANDTPRLVIDAGTNPQPQSKRHSLND